MLKNSPAFSAFAVNDIAKAKDFYGRTLGLEITEGADALELRLAGGAAIEIYPKEDHTPANFTILNFPVANVEETVAGLTAAGVQFERYDLPGLTTDDKGIYRSGGLAIAWFRDPSGNILAVLEQ